MLSVFVVWSFWIMVLKCKTYFHAEFASQWTFTWFKVTALFLWSIPVQCIMGKIACYLHLSHTATVMYLNSLSVSWTARVQNVLTLSKLLAIGVIIIPGVVQLFKGMVLPSRGYQFHEDINTPWHIAGMLFAGCFLLPKWCICVTFLAAGETKNFENAFDFNNVQVSGLPLAFYSGMYAYAGWWVTHPAIFLLLRLSSLVSA